MKTALVNIKDVKSARLRTDASYHLSEGQAVQRDIASSPYPLMKVRDVANDIFIGNRAKRVYVSSADHGIPFLSSSDILKGDLEHVKLASKKYTPEIEKMLLHKGWTLISRSGTIGNCAFANAKHAQKLASEDVIRLVPNNILRGGLVYAYLASKYGHSLLTQGTFGAVIQHIEPDFVGSLPIPHFSETFQKEVDDLMQESVRLREEAVDALEEAKGLIMDFCQEEYATTRLKRFVSVKIKGVRSTLNTRFDPTIYINKGVQWVKSIQKQSTRLGDLNVMMWYPGIFKRAYVENGLPYLKGSSVFDVNPFKTCDHLSKARTPKLDDLWLKEGMLLITCAGACGLVKMITKEYEDKGAIGSPDIIRLVSNDTLFTTEYIFAYLQLPPIYDYMQSLKYGSVIERFDIENIKTIPIVRPTEELSQAVTDIVKSYMAKTYRAFNCEEQAISMVEREIESWNK